MLIGAIAVAAVVGGSDTATRRRRLDQADAGRRRGAERTRGLLHPGALLGRLRPGQVHDRQGPDRLREARRRHAEAAGQGHPGQGRRRTQPVRQPRRPGRRGAGLHRLHEVAVRRRRPRSLRPRRRRPARRRQEHADRLPVRPRASTPTPRASPTPTTRPRSRSTGAAVRRLRQGVRAASPARWPRTSPPRRPPATSTSSEHCSAPRRSTGSAPPTAPSSAPPTPRCSRRRVGRMVLDGAVDPSLTARSRRSGRPPASSARSTPTSRTASRRPTCPLGNDAAAAEDKLADVRRRPRRRPAEHRRDSASSPQGLTFYGIAVTLYDKQTWPVLTQALSAGVQGRRVGPAAALRCVLPSQARRLLPREPRRGQPRHQLSRRRPGGRAARSRRSRRPCRASRRLHRCSARALAWGALSCTRLADQGDHPQVDDRCRRARSRSSCSAPPATRRPRTSGRRP